MLPCLLLMGLVLPLPAAAAPPDSAPADPGDAARPVSLRVDAELGFLAPLAHTVQFSRDGTKIDYVDEGGQDVIFPFARLSTQLRLYGRHVVTLLYQPLQLDSREVTARDLVVHGEVFSQGTPMRFSYGFPFWRAGYTYSVMRSADFELGLGGSLQIRNATIEFASLDGRQFRANRDVGPVPLLSGFLRRSWAQLVYVEFVADGFYAPVKYINGGDSDVVGAILDASARVGLQLSHDTEAFLNLRYLGGGASGTGDPDGRGDGYNSNWLHFLTLSLGARAVLL